MNASQMMKFSRNLKKACRFGKGCGITTVLITGKGEPTLYPNRIGYVANILNDEFAIIELQTNGILLVDRKYNEQLESWYASGLTTIALSVVNYDDDKNAEIYGTKIDLKFLIAKLHDFGFSVRLSCMTLKGYLDSEVEVNKMIDFARQNKVEQLTIRNIEAPDKNVNSDVHDWTIAHRLNDGEMLKACRSITENGKMLLELAHDAIVFDVGGQNVCISSCLTRDTDTDNIRQIIFFPDGHLRYDWVYEGAIIF